MLNKRVAITLTEKQYDQLSQEADEAALPLSAFCRMAIFEYLRRRGERS